MPAPEGNKYAVKAEENRVAFPKAPIRGTKAERQAWNQAQAKSGLGWNDFGRQALNAAAGYVPSEPANVADQTPAALDSANTTGSSSRLAASVLFVLGCSWWFLL